MYDIMAMAVFDCSCQLASQHPHRLGVDTVGVRLKNVKHALLDELEDEVQLAFATKCLLKLHNVLMPHYPQDFYLAECCFPDHFLLL